MRMEGWSEKGCHASLPLQGKNGETGTQRETTGDNGTQRGVTVHNAPPFVPLFLWAQTVTASIFSFSLRDYLFRSTLVTTGTKDSAHLHIDEPPSSIHNWLLFASILQSHNYSSWSISHAPT